jgi:hypothetical protein
MHADTQDRKFLARSVAAALLFIVCPVLTRAQERTGARSLARQDEAPRNARAVAPPVGSSTTIEVVHLASAANEWQAAQTPNFRLWHQQSREEAERLLVAAERARSRIYVRWFGKDGPTWDVRCDLYLYADGGSYRAATGLPDSAPGYAQSTSEGQRIIARRIDLRGDWPSLLEGVLPHEVTHIVMADLFAGGPVPCWANEGIAVLNEPTARIALHLQNLPRYRDEGVLFSVRELVEQAAYPEPRYLAVFYAQSVSLVQFLAREKGAAALPEFLRCACRAGFGAALRRHYGMTVDELEQRWREHAFDPARVASAPPK